MSNMSSTTDNKDMVQVSFAAIDPYIEVNTILPVETRLSGRNMIQWGTGNIYPYFLYRLYTSVPTLGAVIEGTVNFVAGDDVQSAMFPDGRVNACGDSINEIVKELARDYMIYGGFAIQVIRGRDGSIAEVYWLDMRYIRSNKENTVFYYSEKWDTSGRKDMVVYPAFMPYLEWDRLDEEQRSRHASSILYFKESRRQTYPVPVYIQAIRSCEIERDIDDYHLNAINNGFSDGMIVNFNNGIPQDGIKKEIEKAFNEKFSGHQNAGRIMFSWNPSKDNRTDVVVPQTHDYGEKYNSLASRSRQQIFTAFRANPNLFGIPTENTGFSRDEYAEAFNLYNRTQVSPVQKRIQEAFDLIYGQKGSVTIIPFTLTQGGQGNG